jgi:hypothetical protein
MHPLQHSRADVHVVMDLDDRLPRGHAHDSTDVLDKTPLIGNWKSEKERVELRAVESFAQVATGCDEHLPGAGFQLGKLIGHDSSCLLTYATSEDKALQSALGEAIHDPLEMFRPLR